MLSNGEPESKGLSNLPLFIAMMTMNHLAKDVTVTGTLPAPFIGNLLLNSPMNARHFKFKQFYNNLHPLCRKTVIAYGAWVAIVLLYISMKGGDPSVTAQLLLLLTGFPASLLSLLCALDGSAFGIVMAGALGLAQWAGLTYFFTREKTPR